MGAEWIDVASLLQLLVLLLLEGVSLVTLLLFLLQLQLTTHLVHWVADHSVFY